MTTVTLQLDDELATILRRSGQALQQSLREQIVLTAYSRGDLASGKAAQVLGMDRIAFIKHASRLGIPFIDMDDEEWKAEVAQARELM